MFRKPFNSNWLPRKYGSLDVPQHYGLPRLVPAIALPRVYWSDVATVLWAGRQAFLSLEGQQTLGPTQLQGRETDYSPLRDALISNAYTENAQNLQFAEFLTGTPSSRTIKSFIKQWKPLVECSWKIPWKSRLSSFYFLFHKYEDFKGEGACWGGVSLYNACCHILKHGHNFKWSTLRRLR
jgi:hypothetical protein